MVGVKAYRRGKAATHKRTPAWEAGSQGTK
jgi:hypothetical protein